MKLFVNGSTLSIGQLGVGFMILDNPTDHAPTEGEIALSIDGEERRWMVHLPDGIVAGKPHTRIVRAK